MHQSTLNSYLTTRNPNVNKRKNDETLTQARHSKNARHDAHLDRRQLSIPTKNQFEVLDADAQAPSIDEMVNALPPKMPPIVIGQEMKNPKETLNKIRKWVQNMHFKVIRGQHAVVTYSKEDYDTVKTKLKEVNIPYFTFTQKSDKTKKLVLKGIPSMYTSDEVKEDLLLQFPAVVNMTAMKTKNEKTTNPIYLVLLPWGTDLGLVKRSVRYLCDHRVNWQDYVKPTKFRGSQCFRCQAFGHVSNNCEIPRRCVKCSLSHEIGACQKAPEAPPKCANCQEAHPANYRGCVAAKNYKALINPKSNGNKHHSTNVHQRATYGSYSEALRGVQHTKPAQKKLTVDPAVPLLSTDKNDKITKEKERNQEKGFNFSLFNNEIFKLFNMSFTQFAEKIRDFWASYSKITDENEKKMAMISFMLSIEKNPV